MQTLILLPGMMCDKRLFEPLIEHLRGRWFVRVLPIHEHNTIESLAKDVLSKAPEQFALLGLSMGGIVAMEVVKQASGRVTHLALLDTNCSAEKEHIKQTRQPQIEKVKSGHLETVMREEMKPNYIVDSDQKSRILDLCMDMAMDLGEDAFINQSIALRDRADYQQTLSKYKSPALVLCGREDMLCPPRRHELMHSVLENSKLAIIENAGHLPTLEQPNLVNLEIDNLLNQKRSNMTPQLYKLLKSVDTPTVCNAIEVAQKKRGFNSFTKGTMLCSNPKGGSIVGYARTAQIAALEQPTQPKEQIRERRMAYYKHMSTKTDGPADVPSIAVIEDVDYPNAIGAYWGEVNSNIHKAFGMSGALTNGVMRDLGDMAEGFTVIAGSVGPSHGFVHVRTVAQPVEIFGMVVQDNDLIHADQHGAVVIPASVIDKLEDAIHKLLETENIVLEPTRGKTITFEEFEDIWQKFEASRT